MVGFHDCLRCERLMRKSTQSMQPLTPAEAVSQPEVAPEDSGVGSVAACNADALCRSGKR